MGVACTPSMKGCFRLSACCCKLSIKGAMRSCGQAWWLFRLSRFYQYQLIFGPGVGCADADYRETEPTDKRAFSISLTGLREG